MSGTPVTGARGIVLPLLALLVLRGHLARLPARPRTALLAALLLVAAVHVSEPVRFGAVTWATAASVALSFAFLCGLPWLVLRRRTAGAGYARTVLALAAVEIVGSLAALVLGRGLFSAFREAPPTVVAVWVAAVLATATWSVAAQARIWRQATAWRWLACIALVLAVMAAQVLLLVPLRG